MGSPSALILPSRCQGQPEEMLKTPLWEIIHLSLLFLFPLTGFSLLKPAVISQLEGAGELEGPSPLAAGTEIGPQGLWTGKGHTGCFLQGRV